MNNIKKLLLYPLAFVIFIGLASNACEDAVENLAIDVPTTFDETFTVTVTESGQYIIPEQIDMNSPEVQKYRDRIENFTVNEVSFSVVDNLEGGSAESNDTGVAFRTAERRIEFALGYVNLKQRLEGLSLADLEGLKKLLEEYVIDGASDGIIDINFLGDAQGPIDYTVTVTIDGVLKASAN